MPRADPATGSRSPHSGVPSARLRAAKGIVQLQLVLMSPSGLPTRAALSDTLTCLDTALSEIANGADTSITRAGSPAESDPPLLPEPVQAGPRCSTFVLRWMPRRSCFSVSDANQRSPDARRWRWPITRTLCVSSAAKQRRRSMAHVVVDAPLDLPRPHPSLKPVTTVLSMKSVRPADLYRAYG